VEMLVRLRGIEKLSSNIEEKAEAELKQLRDQLPFSANQVIRTAGAFNPQKWTWRMRFAKRGDFRINFKRFSGLPRTSRQVVGWR